MKLEIYLHDIKPLPLNQVYATDFRTKRRFKSKKYTQFESAVNNQLRKFKSDINKFNKYFDENNHCITVSYRFYYPILTKKDNRISKTSGDTSNLIKPIEDVLFKQLIADDSHVIDVSASKIHSETLRIAIILHVRELKYIQ